MIKKHLEGKIINYDVYPSYIKSCRRFCYDEVNEYFAGTNSLENDTQEIRQMLDYAKELHKILDKTKFDRGYINFTIPEVEITLDETGFPIEIKLHATGMSQNMIENFMLQANECVTLFAHKYNLPFVYRIHDKPNEDKIKRMLLETKKLNFKITTDLSNIKPKDISI